MKKSVIILFIFKNKFRKYLIDLYVFAQKTKELYYETEK